MTRVRWDEKKIKNFIEKNEYVYINMIGEFNGRKTKIKIWCGNINHEPYEVCFDNFHGSKGKEGNRCPYCKDCYKKWTEDEIKKFIEKEGYIYIKMKEFNYRNSRIIVHCGNPSHIPYEVSFSNFYENKRCNKCSNEILSNERAEWTEDEIKKFIEKEGYIYIKMKEFHGKHSRIIIHCGNPNHTPYEVDFNNFYRNKRCSSCNQSKGEDRVEEYLIDNNIKYISQYKFKNCKFYKQLPFDFYLPQYNICIEYDGQQHFEIVEHFGGLDNFIDRKIRDTIKTYYCQQNNIKLIRIPYWDFDNIENILTKELNL